MSRGVCPAGHLVRLRLWPRGSARARACWCRTPSSSHDLIIFLGIKALKLWSLAAGIFAIDFDETSNEELFFLVSLGLPEVGFPEGDDEASLANPFAMGRVDP